MSQYTAYVQFWARLTFVSEPTKVYLDSHADLSKAPLRTDFFYEDETKQGYMIWPIARDGEEFGFFTLNSEYWEKVHVGRVVPGVKFRLQAGQHVQATGVVTRVPKYEQELE